MAGPLLTDRRATAARLTAFTVTIVAVFGALWGAVEISLGSYLHVLFPSLTNTFFTGLILAAEKPEAAGQTYFFTSAQPVPWNRVVEIMAESLDRRVVKVPVPLAAAWLYALGSEWIAKRIRESFTWEATAAATLSGA